jgi:hypothetical protein
MVKLPDGKKTRDVAKMAVKLLLPYKNNVISPAPPTMDVNLIIINRLAINCNIYFLSKYIYLLARRAY